MKLTEHGRYITDYLREYGADDFRLEAGGKHNKLKFSFHGREHMYVMSHSDSGDHRVLANIKRDLRRMLGPMPDAQPKTHRTLESMMPDLSSKIVAAYESLPPDSVKQRTWQVTVSAYQTTNLIDKNLRRMYIVFPNNDVRNVIKTNLFSISKLDDEHWKLYVASDYNTMTWRADSNGAKTMVAFTDDTTPFGASIGEAVEADGEILIYLAKADRRPLRRTRPATPPVSPAPKMVEEEGYPGSLVPEKFVSHPDSDADDGLRAALQPTSPEQRMREIVHQIREIESRSPYRLIRLEGGRILWRAPTIE